MRIILLFFSTLTSKASLASLTNRFLMATYWIPSSETSSSCASIRPRTTSWLLRQQTTSEIIKITHTLLNSYLYLAIVFLQLLCFSKLTWLWIRVSHNQELPCPYPWPGRCVWLFWEVGSALSPPVLFLSSQTSSGFATTTKPMLQKNPKIHFQLSVGVQCIVHNWRPRSHEVKYVYQSS